MKNLTKLYFILVSLVSVIGLAIGYGIAGYNFFMSKYIINEEYLVKNYYEIENCKQPDYNKPVGPDNKPTPRTEEDIKTCQTEATTRILATRSLNTKESVIGGLIRGSIAMVLFLSHFPIMLRKGKDEPQS